MANLERFINDDSISDLDPLIKMAVITISSRASILSLTATAGSAEF